MTAPTPTPTPTPTPPDDERERLAAIISDKLDHDWVTEHDLEIAEAILAAGYRRHAPPAPAADNAPTGPCERAGRLADAMPVDDEADRMASKALRDSRSKAASRPIEQAADAVTEEMVDAAQKAFFASAHEPHGMHDPHGAWHAAITAALAARSKTP